jgi:hypothetical protein
MLVQASSTRKLTRTFLCLLPALVLTILSILSAQRSSPNPGCPLTLSAQRSSPYPGCPRSLSGDTTEYWWHYRTLSVWYDSTQLDCMYGEVFVVGDGGSDTLRIRFKDHHAGLGIDTTLEAMNTIAISEKFPVGEKSDLSLMRVLMLMYQSENQIDLGITDTCTWTAELWHAQNNINIATLDSIVICRKDTGMEIPDRYPGDSYCIIHCDLPAFSFGADDSAFIWLKLAVSGGKSSIAGFSLKDWLIARDKFSDSLPWAPPKAQSASRISAVNPDSTVRISVWPVPSNTNMNIKITFPAAGQYTIDLFNLVGENISTIYSGPVNTGLSRFIYHIPSTLPSGEYIIVCRNHNGASPVSSKCIIAH